MRCSMSGCSNATHRNRNVMYFKFPTRLGIQNIWKKICKIEEVGINAVVCSLHFKASDIIKKENKRFLLKSAMPNSFEDSVEAANSKVPKTVKRVSAIPASLEGSVVAGSLFKVPVSLHAKTVKPDPLEGPVEAMIVSLEDSVKASNSKVPKTVKRVSLERSFLGESLLKKKRVSLDGPVEAMQVSLEDSVKSANSKVPKTLKRDYAIPASLEGSVVAPSLFKIPVSLHAQVVKRVPVVVPDYLKSIRSRRCFLGCEEGAKIHIFPQNPVRRAEWLHILGVRSERKTLYICSRHFMPQYFYGNKLSGFAKPMPFVNLELKNNSNNTSFAKITKCNNQINQKICRLCNGANKELTNIFEDELELAKSLYKRAKVQIPRTDLVDYLLCQRCIRTLKVVYGVVNLSKPIQNSIKTPLEMAENKDQGKYEQQNKEIQICGTEPSLEESMACASQQHIVAENNLGETYYVIYKLEEPPFESDDIKDASIFQTDHQSSVMSDHTYCRNMQQNDQEFSNSDENAIITPAESSPSMLVTVQTDEIKNEVIENSTELPINLSAESSPSIPVPVHTEAIKNEVIENDTEFPLTVTLETDEFIDNSTELTKGISAESSLPPSFIIQTNEINNKVIDNSIETNKIAVASKIATVGENSNIPSTIPHQKAYQKLKDFPNLWQCRICKKNCFTSSILERHEELHKNCVQQFCPHCQRRFLDPQKLEEHMKYIHGSESSNKFHCELCNINYSCSTDLDLHNLLHTNDIYTCKICSESYIGPDFFMKHYEKYHKKPEDINVVARTQNVANKQMDYQVYNVSFDNRFPRIQIQNLESTISPQILVDENSTFPTEAPTDDYILGV